MTRVEQQNGFILLPVVLLISLVATLAFMLNQQSAQDTGRVGSLAELKQSEYIAQAGLQHSLQQIVTAGCGPYTDFTDEPFGSHSYSATITPNNAGGTITSYTVDVTDDAYIDNNNSSQNYGNDAQLDTYWTLFPFADKRALYRFDVDNAGIPAGATVVSAVARIFVIDPHDSASINAHQITADWTESTVNWDNINSSYNISSIPSIPKNSPIGEYVDVNITALAQGWINGSIANQGIMLKIAFSFSNDLAQFSSKEYSNVSQRPELIIKVTDGSLSNRSDITAIGTLENGVSRTVTRSDISLYQSSPGSLSLQPDASAGKDGWVNSDQPTNNYGATGEMLINGGATAKHFLNQFDISSIPFGSKIVSAKLEMYLAYIGVQNLAAEFSVHGMKQDWAEGTGDNWDPGDGANWNTSDGSTAWSWSNNHSINPIASTSINSTFDGWHSWEISSLAQQWVSGKSPNYGLLITGNDNAVGAGFYSSDNSTATLRPKLTITYSCECGVTCQIPQGSGNILLVVGDDATLVSGDVKKKALFEIWGYSINLIDDDADQATFDAALANNDAAYISETVQGSGWGTTLVDKLANTNKGVVSEEKNQNSHLGLSSSGSNIVNDSMEIIDNSHYITALFPNGVLPIFSAPMEVMLVTGTPAPGLQTLGNLSGTASLALVDSGNILQGGGTAQGRRVAIPIGRNDKFNWDYLNNNGRLIVQRAIQWGMGADVASPPGPIAHWKLDETSGNTAIDSVGGHDGTVAGNPAWSTGTLGGGLDFDGVGDRVDVGPILDGGTPQISVTTWVFKRDTGDDRVISKSSSTVRADHIFSLGVADTTIRTRLRTTDNGGTSDYDGGVISLNQWVHLAFTYDGGFLRIYMNGAETASYVVTGDMIASTQDVAIGNVNATDDRYWNGLLDDVRIYDRALSSVEIADLATQGGGGISPPPASCDGIFRDEFNAQSYSNSEPTLPWATDWEETGESTSPTGGDIRITNDVSSYQLQVRDDGQTIMREADLSQAGSATLSFDYRRENLNGTGDYVAIEVSYNGGTDWNELDRFTGSANDSSYTSTSYPLDSNSLSANTRIRLLTPGSGMNNSNKVWFDNIQILCSP